ncbi:hypothetical protein Desor_1954 [Desulfosporosinus orientis DSM 765]|uniref:HTH OST-type domain-containing protein n=1 Tax=Desulfosporosinus orientis (strain ATCC 19365 / DSM 765 / NCIMB 8382 / VKM B-1628 / Singapore I) TaxID=768706 RepID=G7WD87_DESOD|nr:NYN domain-containing protein [Desulfosporosinus orientis]AET67572.1 hypothetical protein Desor_1954 [Desulfosporosinus orientis DSM 765]
METNFTKIAVLIDADNAQLTKLKAILDEISKYGRIIVKKAYGDWKNPLLKNWEDELKQLAIKPEQQFAYTKGKNATDIALVIDAMDLLYTNIYDAFVIVCSDADYTPLAIRLRETGAYIFGIGEDKTPAAFRNSCDNFILTRNLTDFKDKPEGIVDDHETKEDSGSPDISEIHKLLNTASETSQYQDDDGWVNAATAGNYIKRARPDFELKALGFSKLSDLLSRYPELYETKKDTSGKVPIFLYKLKK